MGCPVCEYAAEHGSWPPGHSGTHCDGCHRSWRAAGESHCVVCHCHFTSDAAADLHDPYCTPEPGKTRERLVRARRSSGRPLLALRDRKSGETFASYSPKTPQETSGRGEL